MSSETKWNNFLKELSNLLFFWVFGFLFFTLFRLIFIALFHNKISNSIDLNEIFNVLLMGFRFDCTAIAYFLLLPLLFLLLFSASSSATLFSFFLPFPRQTHSLDWPQTRLASIFLPCPETESVTSKVISLKRSTSARRIL